MTGCWPISTGRRAVQYFGARHYAGAAHYDLLAPLLEIATALDPHLVVAYELGSNFLSPNPPNGAGMPQRAIALAEFGIRNNPDEWRLYYDLGFIYYTDLKDYAKAADAFARGSRVPKAHPFLKLLAAQMAEHAGEIETAHGCGPQHSKQRRTEIFAPMRSLISGLSRWTRKLPAWKK